MVNTLCTYKLYRVVEFVFKQLEPGTLFLYTGAMTRMSFVFRQCSVFRQWTWNLDRICITHTHQVLSQLHQSKVLSHWCRDHCLEQFWSKRNQYYRLGKPGKLLKITSEGSKTTLEGWIFADMLNSPIITWSTLDISWQKLKIFTTTRPPKLQNRCSWGPVHKMTGR